ncbi:hypothetical protein NB705_003607 [Xanthomonas sacchari]|nr:hypothetical protein [Xanthomonas sacchari]
MATAPWVTLGGRRRAATDQSHAISVLIYNARPPCPAPRRRDQVLVVPAALAARHQRRAGAVGDGPERGHARLRGRDRAPGQSAAGRHRRASCRRRAAAAAGRTGAAPGPGRCAPQQPRVDRSDRHAAVRGAPARPRRRPPVLRPLHRRGAAGAAPGWVLLLRRRPAPAPGRRRARQGGHRGLRLRADLLLPVRPVPALAAALVELARLVGGGVEPAGAQLPVEPALGDRHLVSAGVPADRRDRAVLVLRLVPAGAGGDARRRCRAQGEGGRSWREATRSGLRAAAGGPRHRAGRAARLPGPAPARPQRPADRGPLPAARSGARPCLRQRGGRSGQWPRPAPPGVSAATAGPAPADQHVRAAQRQLLRPARARGDAAGEPVHVAVLRHRLDAVPGPPAQEARIARRAPRPAVRRRRRC